MNKKINFLFLKYVKKLQNILFKARQIKEYYKK